MAKLRFLVFGIPRFVREGQELPFRRRKALALMAYLVAKRQPQSRDVLCELLWPELDTARANLRRELSLLNSAMGERLLLTDRTSIALNPDVALDIDLHDFWAHTTQARVHLNALELATEASIERLEHAAALYHDDFLNGFSIPDSLSFDEWQYYESESIRRAYGEGLQVLIEWHRRQGRYDRAIEYARAYLNLDPFHEAAHRMLMSLLAWSGEVSAAVQQYETCQRLLRDELDVLPDPETTDLYERIRTKQLSMPQSPIVADEYRHNIPSQTTPFVGREREHQDLIDLMTTGDTRLVTLVAPGGMGKTRLSLEVAHSLVETHTQQFSDGIYQVELAPITDPAHIVTAISDAIGYSLHADERSPRQQLLDYLSKRHMLLILDNYEHLLDDGLLVSDIVQAAPNLQIMVTSREVLNLHDETVFRIEGLAVPEDAEADLLDYGAVQLLLYTARRVNPHFELRADDRPALMQICRAIGGMPLGIILAASWLDSMTLTEVAAAIAHSLDFLSHEAPDMSQRHHNIRAVFDPTWQRLSDHEQAIFMRLSVFQGGFTGQAAQKICDAGLPELSTLVKKSLLQRDLQSGRYTIHELLRQYAAEHLATAQSDTIRDTHSHYFLDWLGRLEDDLKGRRQIAALNEIETDNENVYAAWRWAVKKCDFESIGHALDSFYHYHDMRGNLYAGEENFGYALEHIDTPQNEDEQYLLGRIHVRHNLVLTNVLRRWSENKPELDLQHRHRAQQRGDTFEIALSQGVHGWNLYRRRNNTSDAMQEFEQALFHFRAIGDEFHIADKLHGLFVCQRELQQKNALATLQESIQLQRKIGDYHGLIWSLNLLTWAQFGRGQSKTAIQSAEEMQQLTQLVGSQTGSRIAQICLAWLHFCAGNFASASQYHQLLLGLREDHPWYAMLQPNATALTCILKCVIQEDYSQPMLQEFEGKTAGMIPDTLALALVHCGLGEYTLARADIRNLLKSKYRLRKDCPLSGLALSALLLAHDGEQERAVELLALTKQQPEGLVGWFWKWPLAQRLMTQLQDELGDEAYERAWQRGAALDADETVAELLEQLQVP